MNTKENSPSKSLCGFLIVLKENKLMFTNTKTMTGKRRTVFYISAEDVSDVVYNISEIIKILK